MSKIPEPINHTISTIYDAYESRSRGGDSLGVPMSNATNECDRAIFYQFRWASLPKKIDGIKQSRFDTGFAWEERLLSDLELIGCEVKRIDPTTGKQFSVELANGWLRGKIDGTVLGLPEAPKTLHVIECKSMNDRSFKELVKKKLQEGKPDHYAQCQLYCCAMNLSRCIYYAVNKNDDSRYTERIEYDASYALKLEAKVARIVATDRAPPRLFEDPNSKAAFVCGWCPARAQCHEKAFARQNCRTCISASFEDGAVVRCTFFDKKLTYDEQQRGCSSHLYLPSLVPAIEQIDANEDTRTITYRMADGSIWIDGGREG